MLCSREGTQIWAGPSACCQKCSLPLSSHCWIWDAVAASARLSLPRAMASTSARQLGHQAEIVLARRTIISVSVSTVILVVFSTMACSIHVHHCCNRCVWAHPARPRDQKSLNRGSILLKNSQSGFVEERNGLAGEGDRDNSRIRGCLKCCSFVARRKTS